MSTKLVAAFLDRVQRSGLVSESRLTQLQQELEAAGLNLENPQAVAAALVDRGVLTQWQTEKLLQGKHKGFFLGSYRLLRPLGKGGMGAVFLAQHEMMRRQCAIKVLPQTQIDKHSSVLERFYVEAQAVASLDHQNIVRAYDVSKEVKDNKEIHYLVMEFVEGQDAQAMVQETGPLDYVKAAEIIRQTANGLTHAHENGLIHRDIKPANLLIDKKGIVKILDLGLARFHDDSGAASLTAAHNETVLGTADYLSPEQALNSHNVDPRTDIYSLGCTAYFLLTGHPPFPEGSVAQRLVAHQIKQPKPITEERSDAPSELTAIIGKMMAKIPDDRCQSAADVATLLAAWLVQHGGEDWRRQHTEITGDSSILSLLSKHRDPTLAMSSPASETELELAPLDDEPSEPRGRSAAATSAARKGSGTGLTGRSGSAIKKKPSDDVDLTLADEEETAAVEAAPASEPKPPEPAGNREAPGALLEELPSLTEVQDVAPLATPDLLAELPAQDVLASLDQVDLSDAGQSGPSLGAIDSHVRLGASRGPSSSTRLKSSAAAEPRPKTLLQNIQAVGMPILIGVGGGLLLVLVIILLILFSSPANDTRSVSQRPSTAAGTDAGPTAPSAPADGSSSPDQVASVQPTEPSQAESQSVAPEPPSTPAESSPPAQEPQPAETHVSSATEQPPLHGFAPDSPGSRPNEQQARQPEVPAPAAIPPEPVFPEPVPPEPAKSAPPPVLKQEPPAQTPKSTPAEVAQAPAEATASELSRDETLALFAGLTEFAVTLKPGGDVKSLPKQYARGLDVLAQSIRTKLQGAEKLIDLKVVESSDKGMMEIVMTPTVEGPYIVLNLKAELKYLNSEGGSITVWSADSHENERDREVFRFIPGQSDPRRLWEEKVVEFFKPLGKDHRDAKRTHGK